MGHFGLHLIIYTEDIFQISQVGWMIAYFLSNIQIQFSFSIDFPHCLVFIESHIPEFNGCLSHSTDKDKLSNNTLLT